MRPYDDEPRTTGPGKGRNEQGRITYGDMDQCIWDSCPFELRFDPSSDQILPGIDPFPNAWLEGVNEVLALGNLDNADH